MQRKTDDCAGLDGAQDAVNRRCPLRSRFELIDGGDALLAVHDLENVGIEVIVLGSLLLKDGGIALLGFPIWVAVAKRLRIGNTSTVRVNIWRGDRMA